MYAVDVFIDRLEADVRRANILSVDDMTNLNAMIYDPTSDSMVRFRDMVAQPEPAQSDYDFNWVKS